MSQEKWLSVSCHCATIFFLCIVQQQVASAGNEHQATVSSSDEGEHSVICMGWAQHVHNPKNYKIASEFAA